MNNQDVRVIKTNNLIRTAFLALLAEKGFHAMTVQDILDRAQINRSTFYKHFSNKNEVAKVLVEELMALVKERYGSNYPRRSWGKPILFGVLGIVALYVCIFILAFIAS